MQSTVYMNTYIYTRQLWPLLHFNYSVSFTPHSMLIVYCLLWMLTYRNGLKAPSWFGINIQCHVKFIIMCVLCYRWGGLFILWRSGSSYLGLSQAGSNAEQAGTEHWTQGLPCFKCCRLVNGINCVCVCSHHSCIFLLVHTTQYTAVHTICFSLTCRPNTVTGFKHYIVLYMYIAPQNTFVLMYTEHYCDSRPVMLNILYTIKYM